MLRWRLLFGSLILLLLTGLCWADSCSARAGSWLAPLGLVLCVLATQEMLHLFRQVGCAPLTWATYLSTLLPVAAASVPIAGIAGPASHAIGNLGWLAGGLVGGLGVALLAEMNRYDGQRPTLANLSCMTLAILYVGGLLGFLIQLRQLGQSSQGMVMLLSLVGTVKLSDSCQFMFGKLLGRHQLAPSLSPGKTWEGALLGITAAVALASIVLHYILPQSFAPPPSRTAVVLYCALVSVAGLLGDLAESMLKRQADVKDSSRWLLGLGGVLDLLDSLLLASPVAYFCWASGLLGA